LEQPPKPNPSGSGSQFSSEPSFRRKEAKREEPKSLLEQAQAFLRAGDLKRACTTAQRAEIEGDLEGAAILAQCEWRRGHIKDSADAWARLLKHRPQHREALYGRALALLGLKRSGEALALLKRLPSKDLDVSKLRAQALEQRGDLSGALSEYRGILKQVPGDSKIQRRLGDLLLRSGRLKEGADLLKQAAPAFRADPEFQLQLGLALGHSQDLEGAERALEQSLSLSPNSKRALRNLASLRERRGDQKGALRAWRALMDQKGVDKAKIGLRIRRLSFEGLKEK